MCAHVTHMVRNSRGRAQELKCPAGYAHMASLVVQWTQLLHEDSDVHQDPSLPENVDETYFLQV